MRELMTKLFNWSALLKISMQLQLGARYWLLPVVVLVWPLLQYGLNIIGIGADFNQQSAQNILIGLPLYCVAIGLGIRIIAHEYEQRTLEVCYGIPKGAQRVWVSKLMAVAILIFAALIPLATITALFFTYYPLAALLAVYQGAIFYLVLSS